VRRSVLLIAGVALALATAGCGSSGSSSSGGTHATSAPTGSTTTSSAATSTIDPNFDNGQIVQITTKGLRPKWLVSILGKAVTWQNLTHHGVRVIFDHEPVASKLIPAGSSFSYKPPTPISITYHVTTQPTLHGAVQVTPGATP
jgi:hypothetical protein